MKDGNLKVYSAVADVLKDKFNINRVNDFALEARMIDYNFILHSFERIYDSAIKFGSNVLKMDYDYELEEIAKIKRNKEIIKNPEFFREVDGVKFISDSESSLERLVGFYNNCKEKISKKDNANLLIDNLGNTHCIITDLETRVGQDSSCCMYVDKRMPYHIYFDRDTLLFSNTMIFYHEVGHFYDMSKNMFKINKIIDNLVVEPEKMNIFLKNTEILNDEVENIVADNVDKAVSDDKDSKSNSGNMYLDHDYPTIVMAGDLTYSILEKDGYGALEDIILAVARRKKIKLTEEAIYSHDDFYYNDSLHIAAEVFADFAQLYSIGKVERLDEIFPTEFREQLQNIYMDTVLSSDKDEVVIKDNKNNK